MSTNIRIAVATIIAALVLTGSFLVPTMIVTLIAILTLFGVVGTALFVWDWCLKGDENIAAARAEMDRRHARIG